MVEIIHACATERAVRGREAGGLDNVHLDAKACGEANNGPGILRNVGLVKPDAHARRLLTAVICSCHRPLKIVMPRGLSGAARLRHRPACAPRARVSMKPGCRAV